MPKNFSKSVRLSEGAAGGADLLFCCTNQRSDEGNGPRLSSDPNPAGRGTGKGALSASWGTARLGIGRRCSGSAVAAAGACRIDSKVDLSGKLCASETGAKPE